MWHPHVHASNEYYLVLGEQIVRDSDALIIIIMLHVKALEGLLSC